VKRREEKGGKTVLGKEKRKMGKKARMREFKTKTGPLGLRG